MGYFFYLLSFWAPSIPLSPNGIYFFPGATQLPSVHTFSVTVDDKIPASPCICMFYVLYYRISYAFGM